MVRFLTLLIFLALIGSRAYGEMKEIVIVGGKNKESPSTVYLVKLYSEAFKRIGYQFVYRQLPLKRSTAASNLGREYAGELSRVEHYNSIHKDLLRLNKPHYSVKFLAVSRRSPRLSLEGWESLKGKDFSIAYRGGTAIAEENLPKYVRGEKLLSISRVQQGLELLILGRVDIFIEGSVNLQKFFEDNRYKNSDLYFSGIMDEQKIYMFIHKNYDYLVPKLNQALANMSKEGLYQQYREEAGFAPIPMR